MKLGFVYAKRPYWPFWDWVCQAAVNLGHEAVRVHHVDDLMAADAECELMLFEHRDCGIGWRQVRDHVEQRKSYWIQWNWDLAVTDFKPLKDQDYIERYGKSMRLFDACLVKEVDYLDQYAELGINAHYCDQGVPSDIAAVQHQEVPAWDVLMFGQATPFYRRRRQVAMKLADAGYRVGWATESGEVPSGVARLQWCHPSRLNWLMSNAKCVLDIDLRDCVSGYKSVRHWLIAGAGAIPIRDGSLGCSDAVDAAKVACAMTDGERADCGYALRADVLRSHTNEKRLEWIIANFGRSGNAVEQTMPDVFRQEDCDDKEQEW